MDAVTITDISDEANCCTTKTFVEEDENESLNMDTREINSSVKKRK
jgi:hypothetical protein